MQYLKPKTKFSDLLKNSVSVEHFLVLEVDHFTNAIILFNKETLNIEYCDVVSSDSKNYTITADGYELVLPNKLFTDTFWLINVSDRIISDIIEQCKNEGMELYKMHNMPISGRNVFVETVSMIRPLSKITQVVLEKLRERVNDNQKIRFSVQVNELELKLYYSLFNK